MIISTIDFTQTPPALSRIPIADDFGQSTSCRRVLLDPEGRYAIVRQYGVDQLVLVDLQTSGTRFLCSMWEPIQPIWMYLQTVRKRWWWLALQKLWIYDLQDPTLAPALAFPEEDVFGGLALE